MSEEQNGQGSGVETYSPPEDFAKNANIQDPEICQKANEDREAFWESWARELHWFQEWDQACNWEPPHVQWFIGGKINAAYTYQELLTEVNKFANVLKNQGVEKGDRVAVYLPMIPEVVITMLACARIG